MIRKTNFTVLILLTIVIANLSAQSDQIVRYMDLPQNRLINPALRPSKSFYFGLPVLSGISLNMTNNFVNLSDILMKSRTGDSVISILNQGYDINKFLSKIKDRVLIEPHLETQLACFGFSIGRDGFVFLDVTERVEGNIGLPSDLFKLILTGNNQFLGKRIDLSALSGNFKYYREAGLGFSKNITKKLRIGLKGKLLFGISDFSIDNRALGISVDKNYLMKFDANLLVNISATVKISLNPDHTLKEIALDDNELSSTGGIFDFISGRYNKGVGLDAGATYNVTDKLKVGVSVTDLGYINWKHDVTNLGVKGNFEFGGLDVSSVIDGTEAFEDLAATITDSLKRAFVFTRSNNTYKDHLQHSLYLDVSYNITKSISVGLLSCRTIKNNQIHKSLALSANLNLGTYLSSSVSYNFSSYQQNGIGAGVAFRTGLFQFYFLSDRIPVSWNRIKIDKTSSFILPSNWNIINMRLGMNIVFGNRDKKNDTPMISVD
jgi:hypothetical protein